ncbi:ArsR/SmtB family transcription factor [Actinomadura montaniterrae]|uniref:Helix-turn-helix transcriptional regulator n=1 Tax=Actinomadura montaniterrae TaxID=1803903 RepID=A0A6L3W600_9ACTN|nr:metalloregulator ArsR/SmtB family transcription factor [Actinomadura montaniterrae]KAB2390288.1 helix-turn-helix transcriptional regulator [Actinomadura montaniterrae]
MSKQSLSIVNPADAGEACCAPLVREPLGETEAAELAPLFKALADPVRLRLLSLIACHEGGEACVCDLTAAFDVTAPTISHHLKVLKQAGLIDSERRGTWVYYWLNPGVLDRLAATLGPRATAASAS